MDKIKSKLDLKLVIKQESFYYEKGYSSWKEKVILLLRRDIDTYYIWTYLKCLRKAEYYKNSKINNLIGKICYCFFERRKNRFGSKLGFSISDNVLGLGAVLYHPGVVINPRAQIGKGCMFHGNNCVGNKGSGQAGVPRIGDGVEFGYGAVVIGDIVLANKIKIGANAVVTESFTEEGITIAGVPAKKIATGGR